MRAGGRGRWAAEREGGSVVRWGTMKTVNILPGRRGGAHDQRPTPRRRRRSVKRKPFLPFLHIVVGTLAWPPSPLRSPPPSSPGSPLRLLIIYYLSWRCFSSLFAENGKVGLKLKREK